MNAPLQSAGYTLIELLIVVTLSSLLLITAVALFFTTLVGGGRTAGTEYTKQAGQYAITQMTYLLRNARRLDLASSTPTVCQQNMSAIAVRGQDGNVTILRAGLTGGTNGDTNRIASASAVLRYMTPPDLSFAQGTSLRFDCAPASYGTSTWDGSPPIITISFTLQKGVSGVDQARDIVQVPFRTSVTLRNY